MDLRSPFALSLTSLPRQEGSMISWQAELSAPADLSLEMIRVPEGSELAINFNLASVSEGVWVSGTVKAKVEGQCARCLRPIQDEQELGVGELVYYPERRQALVDEGDEEAEEAPVVDSDHIDLEPILRDAVVLALPFRPLCREDCPGLCSTCGVPWDELPDNHRHEVFNPQFDALASLAIQLEAEESEGEAGVSENAEAEVE